MRGDARNHGSNPAFPVAGTMRAGRPRSWHMEYSVVQLKKSRIVCAEPRFKRSCAGTRGTLMIVAKPGIGGVTLDVAYSAHRPAGRIGTLMQLAKAGQETPP